MMAVGQTLYVNDVLNGKVLRYSLPLTATSLPTQTYSICGGFVVAFGAPGEFCALNANDVGPDERIYVTDNGAGANVAFPGSPAFPNGRIFVLDPGTGTATVWLDPAQFDVSPTGFPPFGANGIAFAKDGSAVFVANMSTHTIYRVGLTGCATACNPGALTVFVGPSSGIRGPDNMVFDDVGNLWVASGQTDQVVAVNPQGQIIKRLGSFDGLSNDGAPKGLLQPSGLAFANGKIYVGNEANQNLRPATDPIPWAQLKLFTISRVTP
jgi:sugar lactone lactonase YvrE